MLFLKNLAFTLLVPGTVTVLIPYVIVSRSTSAAADAWGAPQYLALLLAGVGLAIYLRCLWDFATVGRGTPAPIDPPTRLVVHGLYRYVRNPMYVGVISVLAGEAAFFESRALVAHATAFFVLVHLVVVLYEEPALRRRFGASYEQYRRSVGRWWPGRAYDGADRPS